MNPSRWDALERLLARAQELPPEERAAFVERETGGDAELRAELAALIAASAGADEFVGRLRDELLGFDVDAMLRAAADANGTADPWVGRTISQYAILERIADGGMGVVYRAHDTRLDRPVALKFIAPEMRLDPVVRQLFLDEARAASALDHPNICTIYQVGETEDGRLFMVMPAYDGETLRARIRRGRLPESDALDIGEQIARALAFAHERGVVHRDVKPENVFITRDGVVKLLDFGLARASGSTASGAGSGAGTAAYISPEQAAGSPATERSDVWALGVILFEMLVGARPIVAADAVASSGKNPTVGLDLHLVRPDVSTAVNDMVRRALSNRPANRYANGRQLLDAIRICSPGVSTPHMRATRRVAAIAAVLAIVALGSLGIRGGMDPAARTTPTVDHVLWVDDNPGNNTAIIERLRERGVLVTTALSTAEALERFDPSTHLLVLSDIGRYEGAAGAYVERAGLELLERLRERDEQVRLVFYTSERAVASHRGDALAAGALDIVSEPEAILRLIGF